MSRMTALLLLLSGCSAPAPSAAVVPPRFLALGDSYTIGEGVSTMDRWPELVAKAIRGRGMAVGDPRVIARTGWTTDELSQAIDAAHPEGTYALVTLMIGVNDQYRGRPVEEFRKPFVALLHRSIAFAGGEARRVVVISIPDWGVTPFATGRDRNAIAAEIDRFNAISREECVHAGAHWVDVTTISRHAAADRSLVAGDGLHPSAKMHAQWVEPIVAAAAQALR
jgi:lysophospholipase L1-like esterase